MRARREGRSRPLARYAEEMRASETIRRHDDVFAEPVVALRRSDTGAITPLPGTFAIAPASTVAHGGVPLVALSDAMLAAIPALERYVGLDRPAEVSALAVAAHDDVPILIVGEAGAGALGLARAIRAASRRRSQPLLELTGPYATRRWQRARKQQAATAIVELGPHAATDLVRDVWVALACPSRWRWILVATRPAEAEAALGDAILARAHTVTLPALAERTDDRAALIDRLLAPHGPVAFADLPARAQHALTRPGAFATLDELAQAARRVAAIAQGGVVPAVARALGLELEHLELWAARIGMSDPR